MKLKLTISNIENKLVLAESIEKIKEYFKDN